MIDRPADYDPPAWHRVCSRHFVGGRMTAQNNIPELFHKNNFKQPLSERPDSSIKKRQILAAIKPSQRKRELKFQNKDIPNETTDVMIWIDEKENQPSVFTQEDIAKMFPYLSKKLKLKLLKTVMKQKYEEREHLKPGPKRKLSRYHEYTVTMIRLRQALPEKMLADIFGVSVSRISQIFTTWIYYMKSILKDLVVWPSKALIKKHMPASFKKSYPNTTAVIDCTELFIQRPRNPTTQAKTFSTYKSHNTYKCLVSITPNGNFNYISDLYAGGNTSDRYITEHSGFLDLVSAGDEIMADRGFRIRDLLLERRAYLTMPLLLENVHGERENV
ncbi:unnamed protein product [Mytilus edulis]|uniref:DDE Tnp4 domain-containing protein n=1 Tax=Mytilus edulis TaxID=6550 RepID=A0A8S3RT00_MYTED|nr:unnamed protein product [Mytilus edulis]